MAAPKGNQFWKIRSKHGRDKIFSTPEIMWEAACEYFEWCDNNDLIAIDYKGKDADRVEMPKMRAYTLIGLCHYLGVNTDYFTDFKDSSKSLDKKNELSNEFSRIITRIYEVIYNQKFTGAAAGFLNPNIIARDLGLKDHTEENKVIKQLNYNTSLSKQEIKEINETLESEF